MSIDTEKFRQELRDRAIAKRAQMAENFAPRRLIPRERVPSPPSANVEFVVNERDENGDIKSFNAGDKNFIVTQRDLNGDIKAFSVDTNYGGRPRLVVT